MTLVVRCVVCEKPIENPTCYSKTCKNLKCQDKYTRYLIWLARSKKKKKKAKDYKPIKIIKTKGKTK